MIAAHGLSLGLSYGGCVVLF